MIWKKLQKRLGIPTSKIISDFISDIKNYYSEGYEKKVQSVNIKGEISQKLLNQFCIYLNKILRKYKIKEKKDESIRRKEEMQKRWNKIEDSIYGEDMDKESIGTIISDLNDDEQEFMKSKIDEKKKTIS